MFRKSDTLREAGGNYVFLVSGLVEKIRRMAAFARTVLGHGGHLPAYVPVLFWS